MKRFIDVRDVVGIVGLALLSYGVWQIYPPAAFIAAGAILIAAAVALARVK
jgi:hypothetical protein